MLSPEVMKQLNLPAFSFRILHRAGKPYIFDDFRKRYVALTPEEWVRQHFLRWLKDHLGYPGGLMAVEASLQYNRMPRRADAIIYGTGGNPLMIIECKAPEVAITQDVFDQVARYNYPFGVGYLVVTNGREHFCCVRDEKKQTWQFLEEVPPFSRLNSSPGTAPNKE